MVPVDRLLHRVEQLRASLAALVLTLVGVAERQPRLGRQLLDRADEVEVLDLADEGDDVTLRAAAEAVVELLLGVDGERARLLAVEGAEADPAAADPLQGDVLADDRHDVGGGPHARDVVVLDSHCTSGPDGSSGLRQRARPIGRRSPGPPRCRSDVGAEAALAQHRVGRREPGDRNPVGRARHVVDPRPTRRRRSRRGRRRARRTPRSSAPAGSCDLVRPPDGRAPRPPSGRRTRTGRPRADRARGSASRMGPTSSRLSPSVIWVRSLVPKEKKSAASAISSARSAARGRLDHGSDLDVETGVVFGQHGGDLLLHPPAGEVELGQVDHQRDHDLDLGSLTVALTGQRGLDAGPGPASGRGRP